MFRTPFALQGTELRPDDDLIMLWMAEDDDADETVTVNAHGWLDKDQPNAVYVVLSRALDHRQIKMVTIL